MTRVHKCNSVHDVLGHDPLQYGRRFKGVQKSDLFTQNEKRGRASRENGYRVLKCAY